MDAEQPSMRDSEQGVREDNIVSNPKQDEISTETKASENPAKRNAKQDSIASQADLKKYKKKTNHPPISDMVLESIKSLKMRKGAPPEAIREYIEGHYEVRANYIKSSIKRFLKTGVQKGILERVSGVGPDGRFKIKKLDALKRDKQNTKQKKTKTGVQKRNLKTGKKFRVSGKIKLLQQEEVKKNENFHLNQEEGKTVNT